MVAVLHLTDSHTQKHRKNMRSGISSPLSLAAEARAAFFDDLRDLFSLLPMDVTETALDETRQDLTENFGDEMADTIISQIRVEMGL